MARRHETRLIDGVETCTFCGGTVLEPGRMGHARGSCHCYKGPGHVNGRALYGTDADESLDTARLPYEYDVHWLDGEIIHHTPDLSAAWRFLKEKRAEWWNAQDAQPTRLTSNGRELPSDTPPNWVEKKEN